MRAIFVSVLMGALCAIVAPTNQSAALSHPLVQSRADLHVYRDSAGTYFYTATVPE